MHTLSTSARAREARDVTLVGFFLNLGLSVFKLAAGILGRSAAMVADAVHSFSDCATDVIVLVSMRFVQKPMDTTHNYGHGKFETLAAAIVGIALLFVAVGIFWSGFSRVIRALGGDMIPKPGYIALAAALISIIAKEWVFRYTRRVGRRIQSSALVANAWHHRSDAFSSIGALVGIGGAIILGRRWTVLDPLAGMIVSVFIGKVAVSITLESINELLERALPDERKKEIIAIVNQTSGAMDPHNIRTRKIGYTIAIDLHIRVSPSLTIVAAHNIATEIEDKIRAKYGPDTLITVHTEPVKEP